MTAFDPSAARRLLGALGDHLELAGTHYRVVVVGGVALALGGFLDRTTLDVDVIAVAPGDEAELRAADPLPSPLTEAVLTVARDYGLAPSWFNGVVSAQLEHGLPPGWFEELRWLRFGALEVGLAGRRGLIALKLFAAADQDRSSKHVSDLVALAPTEREWGEASAWVVTQDQAPEFPAQVRRIVEHVDERLGRSS